MIHGVNFGAISTDPTVKLQDSTITQTHGNAAPSTPTAATNVQGDSFEKKGKGKKVFGFLATAAALAAGLAYAVKSGKLAKIENPEKILDKAKNIAADLGQRVLDVSKTVVEKAKKLLPKAKEAVENNPPAT